LASEKKMPNKYGVNFGISLSVWDYIFKTNYIPKDGRDIELGFNDENEFPHDLLNKKFYPLKK
jgi:sterol desaturase/sphingolipid hydroxylase (fatty acid hydroxylase superfamily)